MKFPLRFPNWLGWASFAVPLAGGAVARWSVDVPYVFASGFTAPIAASNHDEVYAVRDGSLVAVDPFGRVVGRSAKVPADALGLAADMEAYVAWTTPSGLTVWDTVRQEAVLEPFATDSGPTALCDAFVVLASDRRRLYACFPAGTR